MLKNNIKTICAFAPASSSNLSVGYDLLGFPVADLGDEVTLTFNDSNEITIEAIECEKSLPLDPKKNTATYALDLMCQHLGLKQGMSVHIKKGIPLCSGLGGSAASAVAAVFALNACLKTPLDKKIMAGFAISAEALACGDKHPDNVVPSLWGELTLIQKVEPLEVVVLPMPHLYCVLVHPDVEIPTQVARQALSTSVSMKIYVAQTANLAGFICSLYQQNWQLLKQSCQDKLIEPQRAHLLPGFYEMQAAALENHALCCSFSGAGPTMYAFAESFDIASVIARQMQDKCSANNIKSESWVIRMIASGPKIIFSS